MSKIKIEDIQRVLAQDNWTLVSDKYQNLDTNLEYICDKGHTVYAPWKRIRDVRECPICIRERLKTKEYKGKRKKKDEFRILALDQSSHISGYSIYSNKNLIDYGIFDAPGLDDVERCAHVKEWMINLIQNYEIDFVGLEGIQYQSQAGVIVFETLARLQGVLMNCCYELKVPCQVVNTNTWRVHCGVKGKTRTDRKRSMQLLTKQWFGLTPTEDEADAIGIGRYYSETLAPKVEIVDWENG